LPDPLYLVAYDVADPRRWRRVYRLLRGYGEWVQLSIFLCRLDTARRRLLEAELAGILDRGADRLLIVRAGATGAQRPLASIGPPVVIPGPKPLIL
jgi:CRISPR-associated protein Cas2